MSGFSLAAVGDIALVRRPSDGLFREGWDTADLRIANLEAPLTTGGVPAPKLIRLRSPLDAATWLRDDLGCQVVSLANNHIMDWGVPGLDSTLAALDKAGISYAGAGRDAASATTARMLRVGDATLAFLSFACTVPVGFRATADHPGLAAIRVRTSYAADALLIDEQPGTPPWVHTEAWLEDVAELERLLGVTRLRADFVVLALHWGVPPQWMSAFQGPLAEYQEALAPRLVAAGADIVLGHHAHTVYGVQQFGSGLVCYSLGNYLFHPLGQPREIPLDAPSRPYRAQERPENRDTFVGSFRVEPGPDGRLRLCQARLLTARLDEAYEARPAEPSTGRAIAERLQGFSASRNTPTQVETTQLVWEPAP